jgi:iron complex outermembrane receptor protein
MSVHVRRLHTVLSLVIASLLAPTARADTQDATPTLDEIVVTAQKREENLSRVPLAVSVFTADAIERSATFRADQLVEAIPSVTFKQGQASILNVLQVRGIGSLTFSTASEPSVAAYVDGVVMARGGQAFLEFNDIERVEVLRGPQGTLFGKNASAGVIQVVSKAPSSEFEGNAELGYFTGSEFRARAGVSGPLSESIGGRLSIVYGKYDGNAKNYFDGKTVNGYEHLAVKGKLRFQLGERADLTVIGDYQKNDDDCCADVIGDAVPNAAFTNILTPALGAAVPKSDQKDIKQDLVPYYIDKHVGASAQLNVDVGPATLTSITAWRKWDSEFVRDGDFSTLNANYVNGLANRLHDFGDNTIKQFTQELRVASNANQPFEYVGGLFYFRTSETDYFQRAVRQCTASTLAADATTFLPCTAAASTIVNPFASAIWTVKFESAAAFGQVGVPIGERFKVIAGARYTDDKVDYVHNRTTLLTGPAIAASFSGTGKVSATKTTVKVGGQYQLNDTTMAYATYAQGYKGPAVNVFFNMAAPNQTPVDPETSDAYEIGLKTKLFDRRVSANIALFKTDYKGFQGNSFVNLNGTIISNLVNVGNVQTKGVEAELQWRALDSLTLAFAGTFMDAKILQYTCPAGLSAAQLAFCQAHNGKPLPFAPDTKLFASAEWRAPVLENWETTFNVNYSYQSEITFDVDQNPLARQGAYGLLGASLAFATKDDRYRISLIGRNLTDKFYTTFKTPQGSAAVLGATPPAGSFIRQLVPRDAERYWGVMASAKF